MIKRSVDILHVSAGTTRGWRVIDETLRLTMEELSVSVERVAIKRPSGGQMLRIGSPFNDLYQASCLVAAAESGMRRVKPAAIFYSSSHAALLQPRRGIPEAVWIDGPIAYMSSGRRTAPLRALEAARQRRLDLVISMSLQYADRLVAPLYPRASAVLHVPVDPSASNITLPAGLTSPYGVTYAGNPGKKGLDLAIEAWKIVAPGIPLVVTGITRAAARSYLGQDPPAEVKFAGSLSRESHRAIVRHADLYVSASRREEYGTAQLEALADGIPVAAVPSLGVVEPLAVARRLEPPLVADAVSAEKLAGVVSRALRMSDTARAKYRERCSELMSGYSSAAFKKRLADDVLPVLLK